MLSLHSVRSIHHNSGSIAETEAAEKMDAKSSPKPVVKPSEERLTEGLKASDPSIYTVWVSGGLPPPLPMPYG